MRASREYRRWVNRLRKRRGRRNGTVYSGLFDHPEMERKFANATKQRQRVKRVDCSE
jgi:hypothetical protein